MPVRYNDAKFVALGEALAAAKGLRLKVGVLGAKGAEREAGSDLTLAQLAHIHEYGTEASGKHAGVPERAPLRKTLIAMQDDLQVSMRKIAHGIYTGKVDPRVGLEALGQRVSGRIRLTITAGLEPPNAASTIRRKKSSTPLIDDGQLYRAYDYLVEEEGGAAVAQPAEVAA